MCWTLTMRIFVEPGRARQGGELRVHFTRRFPLLLLEKSEQGLKIFNGQWCYRTKVTTPPQFLFLWQGVLADKVILGNLGPGLITQDLVVFQVKQ